MRNFKKKWPPSRPPGQHITAPFRDAPYRLRTAGLLSSWNEETVLEARKAQIFITVQYQEIRMSDWAARGHFSIRLITSRNLGLRSQHRRRRATFSILIFQQNGDDMLNYDHHLYRFIFPNPSLTLTHSFLNYSLIMTLSATSHDRLLPLLCTLLM